MANDVGTLGSCCVCGEKVRGDRGNYWHAPAFVAVHFGRCSDIWAWALQQARELARWKGTMEGAGR